MQLFFIPLRARLLLAGAALLAVTVACGGGAKSATPSQLVASASDFDGQSVSVSGTAKGPHTRKGRRGMVLIYQLCDTQCVNVLQFGADASTVTDGSTVSVTGMFRQSAGRVQKMENVILVGGRRPGSFASPAST